MESAASNSSTTKIHGLAGNAQAYNTNSGVQLLSNNIQIIPVGLNPGSETAAGQPLTHTADVPSVLDRTIKLSGIREPLISSSAQLKTGVTDLKLAANLKLAAITTTQVKKDFPGFVDIEINTHIQGPSRFIRYSTNAPLNQCESKAFHSLCQMLVLANNKFEGNRKNKFNHFLVEIDHFKGQALNSELLAIATGKRLQAAANAAKANIVIEIVRVTSSLVISPIILREHYVVAIDRAPTRGFTISETAISETANSETANSETANSETANSETAKVEKVDQFDINSPDTFSDISVICDARLKLFCPATDYISHAKDQLDEILTQGKTAVNQSQTGENLKWECVYTFPKKSTFSQKSIFSKKSTFSKKSIFPNEPMAKRP